MEPRYEDGRSGSSRTYHVESTTVPQHEPIAPGQVPEPFHRDGWVYEERGGWEKRWVRLLILIAGVLALTPEALGCFAPPFGHVTLETVRGIVHVAFEDTPIAGATVEVRTTSAKTVEQDAALFSRQRTRRVAVTTTARDGTFKFERLAPGNYVIIVESPNYLPAAALLTVSPRSKPRTTRPQEAVAVLSRGDGPCSDIRQRERE